MKGDALNKILYSFASFCIRSFRIRLHLFVFVCIEGMGHDGMVVIGNMNMYFFLSKELKQRNGSIVFVLKEWGTMEW